MPILFTDICCLFSTTSSYKQLVLNKLQSLRHYYCLLSMLSFYYISPEPVLTGGSSPQLPWLTKNLPVSPVISHPMFNILNTPASDARTSFHFFLFSSSSLPLTPAAFQVHIKKYPSGFSANWSGGRHNSYFWQLRLPLMF